MFKSIILFSLLARYCGNLWASYSLSVKWLFFFMLKVSTKDTCPTTLILSRIFLDTSFQCQSSYMQFANLLRWLSMKHTPFDISEGYLSQRWMSMHLYTQHLNWVCGSFSSIKSSLFVMKYLYKINYWFTC